jgi:hypothetical protein
MSAAVHVEVPTSKTNVLSGKPDDSLDDQGLGFSRVSGHDQVPSSELAQQQDRPIHKHALAGEHWCQAKR